MNPLLPRSIDNTYAGHKLALWLLGAVVFVKAAMGVNSIFNGYSVATTADRIPLDTYTSAGASAVLSFLALWGLAQVIFSLLGVLSLVRYRAMVPLILLLMLVELVSRRMILVAMPIAKSGSAAASPINLVLIGLLVTGLALSLWSPKK